MKTKLIHWIPVVLLFIFSCESENIEDKYLKGEGPIISDTSKPDTSGDSSEILWLPFNGNTQDSLKHNVPLILVGKEQFVDGMNAENGKALYLDGNTYLLANLGFYDTLSMVFWIKGEGELESSNSPVLCDYGFKALSLQLDATSGATALTVQKNEQIASSEVKVEYLNSFYRYSFVYIEAGGNNTRVYYKGYTSSGDELIYSDELDFSGIIEAESDILYIGRSSKKDNGSSTFFKGSIDELHIYNRTLTTTEIENFASISTR
ncbi:MAG: hypothetical protein JXA77_08360 [Bacteroidales bacterium]|nr:hypothetical protein [Bacteroidales bacterium]MBN2820943.1 hypothetical protein [Bacteroidales bacterium]